MINELKQGRKSTLVIHERTASQTEQDDPWHPSRYTWCAGSIYGGRGLDVMAIMLSWHRVWLCSRQKPGPAGDQTKSVRVCYRLNQSVFPERTGRYCSNSPLLPLCSFSSPLPTSLKKSGVKDGQVIRWKTEMSNYAAHYNTSLKVHLLGS